MRVAVVGLRHRRLAGLLFVALSIATAALVAVGSVSTATATVSGYGVVGPDPATALGFSRPVVAASVVPVGGGSVSGTLAGVPVSATVPAGLYSGAVLVSLVDLIDPQAAAALLPAQDLTGKTLLLGLGLGVRAVDVDDMGTGATLPAAVVETDPRATPGAIVVRLTAAAGDAVYLVTGSGVAQVPSTGGPLAVSVSGPAALLVLRIMATPTMATPTTATPTTATPTTVAPAVPRATTPAVRSGTATSSGLAITGSDVGATAAVATMLLAFGTALVVMGRRRRP